MKFLIDNALSPAVSEALRRAGHDSVHAREIDLQDAADDVLFDRAATEERVVVSADTDFGMLLAVRGASRPSVILFRHGAERRPDRQVALLLLHLEGLDDSLEAGALVTIEPTRIRIRELPLS